jgi:hypothetical protein
MAITTGGYDGTINEVQFATMFPRYSLLGPEDLKATTQAGDRIVSIGNGTALGPGTIDVCTNLPTIQFNAATGTRWDLVVLRRDWQPPGGLSEIKIIEGGTAQAYPAVGTAANQWNRRPGIMDDQPLYLQQVNGTLLGARIDLRCWNSHGGVTALHEMARTYLETVGAEVLIGQTRWQYVIGANSVPGWVSQGEPTYYTPVTAEGWAVTGQIASEPAGSKRKITVDVTVKRTGPAFTLDDDVWEASVPLIPTALRSTAPDVKYLPIIITGGGNHIGAAAAVNPNGAVTVRSTGGSYGFTTNALFTINLSYFI